MARYGLYRESGGAYTVEVLSDTLQPKADGKMRVVKLRCHAVATLPPSAAFLATKPIEVGEEWEATIQVGFEAYSPWSLEYLL